MSVINKDNQISMRLFPRTSGEGEGKKVYHVGDWGSDAPCFVDVSKFSFFVFEHKDNPDDRTLIMRAKKTK